ncbi:hypothetical protein SAMN05421824_2676 [Hyunsoonleella jejuensis]|uniref:Beta-lactamase-inhibitor-like, PepSY-like n=1 Tax=Hyunsoonleella jejuensis TaxID=419940 RepID=A0A1H9KB49_9FLAO|nr:hypothetical protein [Hyunsoonleella jejuensis]SEQ96157.1 hypothetical protein SAMN05421824_2676 [Hyunsoonleella jejuensis]
MKKLLTILLIFGFGSLVYSQIAFNYKSADLKVLDIYKTKPIVKTSAVNAKYYSAIIPFTESKKVKYLEQKVANFNITEHESFKEKKDVYEIVFTDPNSNGRIKTFFNRDGKLIKSYESFKNVRLPTAIWKIVYDKYPKSVVKKTVYQVHYSDIKGSKKLYKVTIIHNNEKKLVKLDENGNFI